jgi:hypothetical protein
LFAKQGGGSEAAVNGKLKLRRETLPMKKEGHLQMPTQEPLLHILSEFTTNSLDEPARAIAKASGIDFAEVRQWIEEMRNRGVVAALSVVTDAMEYTPRYRWSRIPPGSLV